MHGNGNLCAQLQKMGKSLLRLASTTVNSESDGDLVILSAVATEELLARQKRLEHLPAQYFGEPAWEMLLILFINHAKDIRTRTTDLCHGNVALSTGLRYIEMMERDGLIERYRIPNDNRVNAVRLTDHGLNCVKQYLVKRNDIENLSEMRI